MEYYSIKFIYLIFLLIYNFGLSLQQSQENSNFFFGQSQGRFVPSYQNTRNNFFPQSGGRNQHAGSYQEQTIFVGDERDANNLPSAPGVTPNYYQFTYPTTRTSDIFEISPRPFSATPQTNSGFQYSRGNLRNGEYYQQNNRNYAQQQQQSQQQSHKLKQNDLYNEKISVQQIPLPESITERPVSYLSQRGKPLLRNIAISSENNKNSLRTSSSQSNNRNNNNNNSNNNNNNNDDNYYSSQQNSFRGSNRFRSKGSKEQTASPSVSTSTTVLPPVPSRVLPRFGSKSPSAGRISSAASSTSTTIAPASSESLASAFNYHNYRTNQGKRPSSISSSPSSASSALQTSSSAAAIVNNRETLSAAKQGHINNNLLVKPLLSAINITHNGSDKTTSAIKSNQAYLFNKSPSAPSHLQSDEFTGDGGEEEEEHDDAEYEFDENYDDEYKISQPVKNAPANAIATPSPAPQLENVKATISTEAPDADANKLSAFEVAGTHDSLEKKRTETKLEYEEIPEPEDHTIILTDNFYLPKDRKTSKIDASLSLEEAQEDEQNFLSNDSKNTEKGVNQAPSGGSSEKPTPQSSTPDFDEEEEYEYEEYDYEPLEAKPTNSTSGNLSSAAAVEEIPAPVSTTAKAIVEQDVVSPTVEQEVAKPAAEDQVGPLINEENDEVESATDKILGQSVVTVVTTRSVVNGTPSSADDDKENSTTESYVVVASVQTSRSISGAHFLPFPQVEQEEKKQALAELEAKLLEGNSSSSNESDNSQNVEVTTVEADIVPETVIPTTTTTTTSTTTEKNAQTLISTESIIDKLDRVQSELSSGVLTGKFPVLQELTTEAATVPPVKTSSKPSVVIRKFMPKTTTVRTTTSKLSARTTTAAPATTTKKAPDDKKIAFDEIEMDDLSSLLPPGFKLRPSFKNKKITTTTSTTPATSATNEDLLGEEPMRPEILRQRNATIARSFKNGGVAQQDINGFLPKGYRSNSTASEIQQTADILSKIKMQNDLEKLLPADYKAKAPTNSTKSIIDKVQKVDISAFLPPGFKLNASDDKAAAKKVIPINNDISKFLPPGFKVPAEEASTKAPAIVINDDISKFLPPGFQLENAKEEESDAGSLKEDILKKVQFKDVSDLLPPGFKANASAEVIPLPTTTAKTATTTASGSFKVVFPSRPGFAKKPGGAGRATTPKSHAAEGPTPPEILIRKGPPTRATTEFTGWPTPPTTPFSIEKLLQQQKAAELDLANILPVSTTTRRTTTTTVPTTTPRPTEPGLCRSECDLAGTIRIVEGVKWKPELLDHYTEEWKSLAKEVEVQLNEVYSNSKNLSKWYKKIRIDSFSKGSVLVDYFVELSDLSRDIDTLEIRRLFHEALMPATIPITSSTTTANPNQNDTDFDYENDIDRETAEPRVKETFLLGKFMLDPVSTDFIVIPKPIPKLNEHDEDDNLLLPQWAIAVMVIGFASLLFVILFGVTVLINRQKASKKKQPTPLTADMLNELNKNHMGGEDNFGSEDLYNLDDNWDEHGGHENIKSKRLSSSVHGSNIYDSWRSQHHPDYYYNSHDNNYGYKSVQYPAQHGLHHPHHHHLQQHQQHLHGSGSQIDAAFMMHEPISMYPYQHSHNHNQTHHNHINPSYSGSRRYYRDRDYNPNF